MAGVRPMSQMRKIETKEAIFRARKRILRYLVYSYLRQEGLLRAAETFADEAELTTEYELCDNVDLDIILQDYCSYYLQRFNKQPLFLRQRSAEAEKPRRPPTRRVERTPPSPVKEGKREELSFTVTSLKQEEPEKPLSLPAIERKPLSGFLANATPERRQLAELVYQDIVRHSGVTWDDIKGLDEAKSLLMEAVVYPVRYPEVFTGLLSPWRGILLHGVPGTGKTLLARALAAEGCAFFSVSASTLVTKWRGDSEKIVKILFEMASYYAPSIIFMDEVESLAAERTPSEHEASRRLTSQLLAELDGVSAREGLVFLLANSNMPWEIDAAMLRRLEKRIHIPLPNHKTRTQLFQEYLQVKNIELVPKVDFEELAAKTAGYSGSDIKLVCKEALMTTVRRMLPTMAGKGSPSKVKDKLHLSEILTAIEKTKPVSKHLAQKHETWQSEMGCS